MTDSIMSKLKQQLEIAGLDTLHLSDKEAQLFAQTVEEKADFFDQVRKTKTESDPNLLLLGLLTKIHIETTGKLESQLEGISIMTGVLTEAVGSHADKFNAEAIIELSLVTKLWLMVQGYLNMDFSLANDHAMTTSVLLAKGLHSREVDEIRTELIASYYHGKEKRKEDSPNVQWTSRILRWFNA